MKSRHVLTLLTLGIVTLLNPHPSAQRQSPEDPLWRYIGKAANDAAPTLTAAGPTGGPRAITTKLRSYGRFAASDALIVAALAKAPLELTSAAPPVMTIPLPDGTFERVKVEESPIFSPELQAQYDYVHTYAVRGVDDLSLTGRLDHTPAGFHAMLISERGVLFVDPAGDSPNEYVSYWKTDATGEPAFCQTHGGDVLPEKDAVVDGAASLAGPSIMPLAMNPSGAQLRTYRLAVSVTGEYTRFLDGNPPAAGTPATVAQIATTVNRVTGVFERDVQIRLNLTTTRIFLDPATDPFSSGDFRTENQTTLDANPGNANYDIGHVFSQGGTGGVATLGVVCVAGSKARGFTSRPTPSGDPFDIDFVAHEMGHQLAANHTWTSNTNSCADAGQFVAAAAYEPGSGSTIMSYAGICSPQDVQANSDAYLHTRSYDEIVAFRTSGAGNSCGTVTATGNSAPLIDAGPDCTIPRNTPFTLTATGSDPDGDALTFLWEQFDLGTHGQIPAAGNTTGPMFRSRPATAASSRTFPRLQDILSGAATPWEVLPNVDRTMNFRVTARDNRAGGGGVDFDSNVVTVSGDPFGFTFPATGSSLECGGSSSVQWTVGGGSIAPNVAIQISTDDGQNFSPFVASTPNDGSHAVTIPQTLTALGRLRLVPSAQCFFAVSQKFSIVDTLNPSITAPADVVQECTSPGGTPVTLGVATATDQCDSTPAITNNAPPLFPLGMTSVLWTATDDSGHQGTDSQQVTIQDTTPPVISSVTARPNSLWPPNHKMVPVSVAVSVADVCDTTPSCQIKSVASNEPINGTGDGNTDPDWVITGPLTLQLRAERAGNGTGRTYTITVECTDGSGNSSTKDVTIVVAHDQR
jgi:hypothetical protein